MSNKTPGGNKITTTKTDELGYSEVYDIIKKISERNTGEKVRSIYFNVDLDGDFEGVTINYVTPEEDK